MTAITPELTSVDAMFAVSAWVKNYITRSDRFCPRAPCARSTPSKCHQRLNVPAISRLECGDIGAERTGSFEQASYAIQDTPDIVAKHYGRFLPENKAHLAAQIFNKVMGKLILFG
jgi:hypothetical protein